VTFKKVSLYYYYYYYYHFMTTIQDRTIGFCWSKVLLPVCPCWWQLVHSD